MIAESSTCLKDIIISNIDVQNARDYDASLPAHRRRVRLPINGAGIDHPVDLINSLVETLARSFRKSP